MYTLYSVGVAGGSRVREVAIRLYGDSIADETQVRCTCKYFTHNVEVALSARGSAVVSSNTGEFPAKRNPSFKPHLCPHLLIAALAIAAQKKQQLQDVMGKRNKKVATKVDKRLKDMMK